MRRRRRPIRRQHPVVNVGNALEAHRAAKLPVAIAVNISAVAMLVCGMWSDPQPNPAVLFLRSVLLIGIGAATCYALWSFWLFIRPRLLIRRQQAAERQRREQSKPRPADRLIKHLRRGEVPYLSDDGEILFEKKPKHTSQSQEHGRKL